jgi:thiol-disulfide isomerase/thioredoxin
MKYCIQIGIIVVLLLGTGHVYAQKVKLVDRQWISAMSQNNSDTIYVINFWATWCKPCVEELPHFEKLNTTYASRKVKVILVSCDFKKQLETRVKPFIKTKHLKNEVVFMNESDPNSWIERVDSRFSGAIPATLIINGAKEFRFFKEGEITYEELESIIKPLIH